MYSTLVRGTGKRKTTLNWWEYWIGHCWMTGWQSIHGAFRIWRDLMTDNYKDYTLLHDDDPFTECYEWFWVALGEDDVYPKEFLEHLMQLAHDVETGKEKVYPLTEDFFDKMREITDGIIIDSEEELDDETN